MNITPVANQHLAGVDVLNQQSKYTNASKQRR